MKKIILIIITVGVYVFDKEGKNLYVAKGTKKEEIEEFE